MLDSTVLLEDSDGSSGGRGRWSAFNRVAVEFGDELDGGRGAEEEGGRSSGSKRWPREETVALLKIRSDMDQAFRDSAFKAPLWDEVSSHHDRKLGELGYNRNAKKCKEKFENIYKYHKRTKAGRASRHSGKRKNYRFYEQLESFQAGSSVPSTPSEQLHFTPMEKDASSTHAKISVKPVSSCQDFSMPCSTEFVSVSTSTTSSSGKDSERSVKKKRKLADYFQSLMREVLQRQEDLQKKFLEVIEKIERDRAAREEAWKVQEAARMKREREFLAKEKAISAAKDVAILAFLQKLSRHMKLPVQVPENLDKMFEQAFEKQGIVLKEPVDLLVNGTTETSTQMSSSRWPKAEVEALIMLKTDLDSKYQDNGLKGTLWEDISTCMKKLGYSRNPKRCKEKWENINKYYKRVKYGDKKRPGYSRTCPYFGMLDTLYAEKSKDGEYKSYSGDFNMRPEQILMQMIGGQQSLGEYEPDQDQDRDNYEEVEEGNGSGDAAINCPSAPLE
ncbi:trihelix transcription factor DF1-like isoform X1 [Primulina eburnea]|uniref:trihelix transcription factor DF1-like isoform X1 n=1 Tax=Primulina eburnea TaxID=1245227 RepID=UPI003C6C0A42